VTSISADAGAIIIDPLGSAARAPAASEPPHAAMNALQPTTTTQAVRRTKVSKSLLRAFCLIQIGTAVVHSHARVRKHVHSVAQRPSGALISYFK
jgi:hypothetical protein